MGEKAANRHMDSVIQGEPEPSCYSISYRVSSFWRILLSTKVEEDANRVPSLRFGNAQSNSLVIDHYISRELQIIHHKSDITGT